MTGAGDHRSSPVRPVAWDGPETAARYRRVSPGFDGGRAIPRAGNGVDITIDVRVSPYRLTRSISCSRWAMLTATNRITYESAPVT